MLSKKAIELLESIEDALDIELDKLSLIQKCNGTIGVEIVGTLLADDESDDTEDDEDDARVSHEGFAACVGTDGKPI